MCKLIRLSKGKWIPQGAAKKFLNGLCPFDHVSEESKGFTEVIAIAP